VSYVLLHSIVTSINSNTHYCWYSFFLFFALLLWWVGVHCGIYTGSYNVPNVSYMNSPTQQFFISYSLRFLEWFQQALFLHLPVYTFYCTRFTLLPTFSNTYPCHWCQPSTLGKIFSAFLFSDFVEKKEKK
jgi:hypothetical protein